MYASNPHELARAIEAVSLGELGIAYMEAYKARKASNKILNFFRNDFPEDTEEWRSWVAISYKNDGVQSRRVPVDYHLQEPYASDLEENYRHYSES